MHANILSFHRRLAGSATLALLGLILALSSVARAHDGVVAFGLTNAPIGAASLSFQGENLVVSAMGNNSNALMAASSTSYFPTSSVPVIDSTYYGVSVFLGEADSALFFYPYTSASLYNGGLMVGRLYGQVDGQPDQLLTTMFAARTDYATFTVGSDFSPLGATNVTFEVFNGETRVAVSSNQVGQFVIYADSEYSPRANPLQRLADGSLAAVVELRSAWSLVVPGVTNNDHGLYGNRIVMRPELPNVTVDFASRLDVTSGGGLNQFTVTEERLGVFRRGHRALGQSLLQANGGRLTIATGPPIEGQNDDPGTGVVVELEGNRHFAMSLQPVTLAEDGAALTASAAGTKGGDTYSTRFLGLATIANVGGALQISGSFAELEGGLLLSVYRDDVEVGTVVSPTLTPGIAISGAPLVTGFDGAAESGGDRAGLAVRLDRTVAFAMPDGSTLEGNQFRFRAADTDTLDRLTSFSVIATKVPAFTITAESGLESIYLVDYLPEFALPASVKKFTGTNQGAVETLTDRVSSTSREGQDLITITGTPSTGPLRSQNFSYRDSALFFHGSSEAPLDLFSAGGVRLLPTRPTLGQTYHGVGSFTWRHLEFGIVSPVTVNVATRVAAFEPVTVPAGAFFALRLESTFVFGPSLETNAPTQRTTTWWLVDGVGVVRHQEMDQFADHSTRSRSADLEAFNIITSPKRFPVGNVGATIRLTSSGPTGPDDAALSIRWLKDGAPLTGASSAILDLTAIQFADAGDYSVVRSNAAGQVSVAVASLRVIPFNDAPTFRVVGKTSNGFIGPTHVAVDAQGNTYLAGTFAGSITFGNITLTSPTQADPVFVVKYDSSGNVLWAREGGGPRIDSLTGIGLDAAGNLYLSGLSRGEVRFGVFTAGGAWSLGTWFTKMNPAGEFQWATTPTGTGVTIGQDLAVDASGNSYVVGDITGDVTFGGTTLTNGSQYFGSMFATKVDATGQFVWARQPEVDGYVKATTVALSPAGELMVGGYFEGTVGFGATTLMSGATERGFLAKLNTGGTFLSARTIGAGINSVRFDSAGSLYLAGWFNGSTPVETLPLLSGSGNSWMTYYTARLEPDGNVAWAKPATEFNSSPQRQLVVDPDGGFYVGGTFYSSATVAGTTFGGSGVLVSRFDRDGQRIFVKHVTGQMGVSHGGMAVDGHGNFYLSGQFYGAVQLGDALLEGTTRYSPYLVKLGAVMPPEIQSEPTSQTVNPGAAISFGVTATGANLLYQWRHNGIQIAGANDATLVLQEVEPQDAGTYTVSVQNGGGVVMSAPAQLQLNLPNAGALQFSAATYVAGEAGGSAAIEILRTGPTDQPASITLHTTDKSARAGSDYLGTVATLAFAAGESSKTIAIPILADGLYELEETVVLRLRNPGAGATLGSPNVATLTITDDDPSTPVILTQPRDRAVIQGRTAVFVVEANGEAPLTYQWRKGGDNLAGATSATLALANVQAGDAAAYSVVVRNGAGEVTSTSATLTVRFLPVIVLEPQSITVPYGEPVTLSILASNNIIPITNAVSGSGVGTAEARFQLPASGLRSVLRLAFDFQAQSDVVRIYDGFQIIYDSSYVLGTGNAVVEVAPGVPRSLEIVVNADASGGEDGWSFQAEMVSRPIEYRWRKNGLFLLGVIDPVYTIASARATDSGEYTVHVTDQVGTVISQTATLVVTSPVLRINAATNAPNRIQLWWVSPDHRPEFIEDLNDAGNLEEWTLLSDYFSGMAVEIIPGRQSYFRLRPISD